MPLIEFSKYNEPPYIFKNPHISTIYINKLRKTSPPDSGRERIELADGDFLDIDFMMNSTAKAVVLCHGLEGNSVRNYNNTAAAYFDSKDFSVFAWNNRSCSGEMNRLPKLYHHAAINDLDSVVKFVTAKGFQEIYLLGFSMGGVQILNYFGKKEINSVVKAAVAVSAPIYLKTTAEILKNGFNKIYLKNFLISISKKLNLKAKQFPELLDWEKLKTVKSFDEIDEYFTAPLHGFENKEDYYRKASPGFVLENIETPVLILNALNDPFLGDDSYPTKLVAENKTVSLETPKFGGHCAFPLKNSIFNYSEVRAYEFFNSVITSSGL